MGEVLVHPNLHFVPFLHLCLFNLKHNFYQPLSINHWTSHLGCVFK